MIGVLLLALGGVGQAVAPGSSQQPMECESGPVERKFGATDWLVFGCSDRQSAIIITKSGNPAAPFVFELSLKDGHYAIQGEGNGDKRASDAAGDEIHSLGDAGIRQLVETALHAGHSG